MEKIKLGIVGCGIAARRLHWPALEALDGRFEIVGVTNRSKDKAESFAELVGGTEVLDSYEELLELERLDAVDLALPIKLNPEFVEKAVENDLDVICEKPIAPNVKEGKRVVEASRRTDRTVYVAENYRHREEFEKAKNLIEGGKIGRPRFAVRRDWQGLTEGDAVVRTGWRREPDHVGGFLSDGGVHHIASLRKILGDIEAVSGFTAKTSDLPGEEDTMELSLRFEDGTLGNYFVSYGIEGESEFVIHGDRGRLVIEDGSIEVVAASGNKTYPFEPNEGFEGEFRDFYEVLTNGKANDLGAPYEALKDLAVIQAGLTSAEELRQINVEEMIKGA